MIFMKTQSNFYLFLIALISAMGGFLFGYDWVVIGGAKPFYEQYFGIANDPVMQGWAMSSALIGCLFGALSAGKLSDRLGRKPILILAAAAGIALAKMPSSDKKEVVMKGLFGLQDLLFMLIHGLIWALPLGIVAFAAQLSAQFSAGIVMASLGKYVAVILGGNVIQFFIILPLFLLARGLNPVRTLGKMMPAVLMALFTKSSAATLPVTMQTAEDRLGVSNQVSRFVLPICTTINMNGCAAFILVTSLFLMQNGGMPLPWTTMILWLFISVISAVGNAGVPMGCYFLTLSLMSGINAPIGIMGIILPIYTIIDMIETAENVWSDSCVCAMVDRDLKR